MPRSWTAAALALAGTLAFAAPSPADGSLRVDLRGDEGGSLRIEIPASWARAFLSAVDCEPSDDAAVRRALRVLDREGDGGSVRFVDRDGDRIHARRDGDVLRLDVFDPDDGERAEIEMPWPAAECWLLGRARERRASLDEPDGDFRLELVSDDARIHVSID